MAQSVTNTFEKGINQDVSFILQPDGTYRNMKNGMLISYDGNHYTVEMTKGNRVIVTINQNYTPDNVQGATLLEAYPAPIGFSSFIDDLVVFSTNNESSTGGYGEIGVISFTKSEDDMTGIYVPYYNHKDLKFTKIHKIESFTFKENDNISKVYWTDNFNEPRVFDVSNPTFTTYIPSGSLIVGKKYMVLNGVIDHNTFWYGPSEGTNIPTAPFYVNDNVFEAANANFTTVAGTPLVIEYFPISLLSWTPTRLLGNIDFLEYGLGNKNCGSSIYFYRLSSTVDGIKTSWSYASNPIHVGTSNETTYLTGTPYRDFVGKGSETTIENSGKSVKLKISDIDTNFDTIEVCCAEFDQKADIPYSISICTKEVVTSDAMTIEDTGGGNFGTVTISELTTFPASILRCKTLATNKNYNIIGNTLEREEFELDLTGVTLSSFEYPMVSQADPDDGTCINGNVSTDVSPTVGANPSAGSIRPWSRWLVTDDSGGAITYNSITYSLGEVFVGVSGFSSATIPSGSQCRPCTTRNKFTTIGGDRNEDAIELKTGFWDYKDPAVASHNKGYWSDEKYRLAFVAFDTKGNPYYAKWIGDITMPDVTTKGGLMRVDGYIGDNSYSLNPSGIKVSGLDLPESVINKLHGFSIMRAERDATIITQGLLMQTLVDISDPMRIMPTGCTRTDYNLYNTFYTSLGDLSSCICPDNLVGHEFVSKIGEIDQTLKEAFWLDGTPLKSFVSNKSLVSKMFDTKVSDSASPRTMKLKSMNGYGIRHYDEYNGDSNIISTGEDFYNREQVVNGLTLDTSADNACVIDSFGAVSVFSVGCKKSLVMPELFPHYGPANTYNSNSAKTSYEKIAVNFMTDTLPANQYGGSSLEAIANTTYMSTGHYQVINSDVKTKTLNGTFTSGIYSGENKYTFNDIEIFGGDCFTNLIDIAWGLYDGIYVSTGVFNSMGYSLWFPMECNTNYNLRRGLKVSNKNMFPACSPSTVGIVWSEPTMNPGIQLESFSYNKGYSTEGTFIKYPALPNNYKFTGKFEYRVRWSKIKFPGELNNSFRYFSISDYRDLDGQRGQINNLRSRDSKLFYWQDHSVGYTPILERQLVGGSSLGDATSLGVTGVIDMYDEIDTYFGNQHQHGLTDTEYGFAWFDMRRRAFLAMGIGSKPEEVSMIKGLQTFFNNEFNEGNVFYPNSISTIYNTNNLSIPEIPLLGYGIVGVYDPTFKMTYLTFKYMDRNVYTENETDYETLVNKDFTLGYSHVLNSFVTFTDCTPAIWHNHNDLVLTANNGKNTKPYNVDMPTTGYAVGDTVKVNNSEFICIKDVIIASYPGTLTPITGTNPLAPSSQYWSLINKSNQIYIHNNNAELAKFFGKVWNHELDVIVNPKTDLALSPQNIEFKGNKTNWTDVYAYTDNQSSSDLNISSTNRNYRWIQSAFYSSLPLDKSNGRLIDYYVRIKFVYKNYVTNPTVAKNVQKLSQWLKTYFSVKR